MWMTITRVIPWSYCICTNQTQSFKTGIINQEKMSAHWCLRLMRILRTTNYSLLSDTIGSLDLYSLRGISRIQSNIKILRGIFRIESNTSHFGKTLYLRCLTGLWMRLWVYFIKNYVPYLYNIKLLFCASHFIKVPSWYVQGIFWKQIYQYDKGQLLLFCQIHTQKRKFKYLIRILKIQHKDNFLCTVKCN